MKCRQAANWIDAALDGDAGLTSTQREQLEAHLAGCAGCRRQWEALRTAEAVLRVPQPVAAPAGMLDEFRRRLEAERAAPVLPPSRRWSWSWLWPVGSLAAAGAAAALALHFSTPTLLLPSTPDSAPAAAIPERTGSASAPTRGSADAPAARAGTGAPDAARGRRESPRPPSSPAAGGGELRSSPAKVTTPAAGARPERERTATDSTAAADFTRPHPQATTAGGHAADLKQDAAAAMLGLESTHPKPVGRRSAAPEQTTQLFADWPTFYVSGQRDNAPTAAPLAPEFEVSPAVLSALQRPVRVSGEMQSLQDAAERLSEAADVRLEIEGRPSVLRRQVRLSAPTDEAPLWVVLQNVAQEHSLRIYPKENQLVLRPAEETERRGGKAVARAEAVAPRAPEALSQKRGPAPPPEPTRTMRAVTSAPPAGPAAPSSAPAPFGGLAGGGLGGFAGGDRDHAPESRLMYRRGAAYPGLAPDRSVWPSQWGLLPEQGFRLPSPEEFAQNQLYGTAVPQGNAPDRPAAEKASTPQPSSPAKPQLPKKR
ncbi:MAG: zf-HC2 domain-containing protein [Armatimonadota bacterium]